MSPRNSTLSNPPAHPPPRGLQFQHYGQSSDQQPLFTVGIGEELAEEPLGFEGLERDVSVVNTQTFLDLMSENCRVAAAALETKVKVAKAAQP